MEQMKTARELLEFLEKSPSPYHAVANMAQILKENGFKRLEEAERWRLEPGKGYFVIRNDSAIISFRIPKGMWKGFHIVASHSDSPCFKIKENPEMEAEGCVKLNVERYGGMLCAPWMDRPLSVAGRVAVRENGQVKTRLACVDRDLLMIPNLAIHMNRQANEGISFNAQKDLLPLLGTENVQGSFWKLVAEAAGVTPEEILGHDLYVYNRQKGSVWGAGAEFLSCGRLDDLQCAFASLKGFLAGKKEQWMAVHCVLDSEEVGSSSRQGAASTFLKDVLTRINSGLGGDMEAYLCRIAESFLISADNAHAAHPNYGEKADPVNRPRLNGGIVIKFSANGRYCTDGFTAAVMKEICREAGVPYQIYTNRSDMAGGSTLGNLSAAQVPLATVDVGLPQLAMHSPYETAGVRDTGYLIRALETFFL